MFIYLFFPFLLLCPSVTSNSSKVRLHQKLDQNTETNKVIDNSCCEFFFSSNPQNKHRQHACVLLTVHVVVFLFSPGLLPAVSLFTSLCVTSTTRSLLTLWPNSQRSRHDPYHHNSRACPHLYVCFVWVQLKFHWGRRTAAQSSTLQNLTDRRRERQESQNTKSFSCAAQKVPSLWKSFLIRKLFLWIFTVCC